MINIGKDLQVAPEKACTIMWEDRFTRSQSEAIQGWNELIAGGGTRLLLRNQPLRGGEVHIGEAHPEHNLG